MLLQKKIFYLNRVRILEKYVSRNKSGVRKLYGFFGIDISINILYRTQLSKSHENFQSSFEVEETIHFLPAFGHEYISLMIKIIMLSHMKISYMIILEGQ